MKKLGFCFLIYDILNNEDAWEVFFRNVDPKKYGIYIHYKTNTPLTYFEKYKLTNCIPTQYCHVSIIHAHNLLFKTALDDGCDKVISLSQACIPFKSFDYIYTFLTKDDLCHFNMGNDQHIFPRCSSLLQYYDEKVIRKSSNWFILNRTVGNQVVSYKKQYIDQLFGSIWCPEEHYFITIIYLHNLQDQLLTTPNLADGATTFTNWKDMNYTYTNTTDQGLKHYIAISPEEIQHLLSSPCLFGRKFMPECRTSLTDPLYINGITSSLGKK